MGRGAGGTGQGAAVRPITVRFQIPGGSFDAVLHDNPITAAIIQRLPITSQAQRWGEEIYFDVPVKMANTQPTLEVKVGDLAYWPEGPCLCIFFGRTPASKGGEPRPASPVTIIGRTNAPPARLHLVAEGATITVSAI